MRTLLTLIVVIALGAGTLSAQRTGELQKRENELQKLRSEIDAFEKKLTESVRRERSTLQRIDDLEQQSTLLRNLIRRLRDQEQNIAREIGTARTSIERLEDQLSELTTHYAGWVRSVYKNGRVYDLELLFSSKSLNQFYIRLEYMKKFSDQRVRDLTEILSKKTALELKNKDLQEKLQNERKVLTEKTREEKRLSRSYSERQNVLNRVRRDKKSYQQELTKRTAAIKKVEQLIAALIEQERVRKERESDERKRSLADRSTPSAIRSFPTLPNASAGPAVSFAKRRGRLRWPVSSGEVHTKFGTVTHPVLKTKTENSGIDIATRAGSPVFAVADGEVSLLSFIPGFGNVLIVNHFDGYRTVYAHMADITVVEDQRVSEGMEIGRSGETVSGSMLHFEIWHEKAKQNPESWLTKR